MERKEAIHGGDIYHREVIADFSVNINPLGLLPEVKNALLSSVMDCHQYPDYHYESIHSELAQMLGMKKEEVLCGNGASDLFMGIVRTIMPKRAIVFAPSFYGYIHALSSVNCKIEYEFLLPENQFEIQADFLDRLTDATDLIFLCIPNNPTGNMVDINLFHSILERCKEKHIYVVLDECFLEFTDDYEKFSPSKWLSDYPNVLIVNAFTKTYAIPGIRFGYLCARKELIKKVEAQLSEWRVSIPAMAAAMAILTNEKRFSYLEETKQLLKQERKKIKEELEQMGMEVFASDTNFMLLRTPVLLYEKLLERRILIRHCQNYIGLNNEYYRIAVKKPDENEMLIQEIKQIMKEERHDY